MRLQPSDPAKPFSITDIFGHTHTLEQYAGKKLLLSFYRYVACPLCNLRIHELSKRWSSYAAGGLMGLAFFESPQESIRRAMEDRTLPFPIVADPERTTYASYGVESSWAGYAIGFVHPRAIVALANGFMPGAPEGDKALLPADFLIGPDLRIHTAFYAGNITQHLPMEAIEAFLGEPEPPAGGSAPRR
jgi:peroxiredoxin